MRKLFLAVLLAFAAAVPGGGAFAQKTSVFPTDVVVIEVPFTAGGSTDVFGRMLAEWLSAELGVKFVVENTTGAAGAIGARKVLTTDPPGSQILLATPGPLVMLPLTEKNLPYDLWKDFRPVSLVWEQPVTLLVRKDRFATVDDFIEAAKANPGGVSYGSAGINSLNHIAGEFFANVAGIELLHVPYQGINPAITATLSGDVDAAFVTAASLVSAPPELQGLLVSSQNRLPDAPDVKTSAEAGLPDYIFSSYGGMIVPADTPDEEVDALVTALENIFADPEKRKKMEAQGVTVQLLKKDELKAFTERQTQITREALDLQ